MMSYCLWAPTYANSGFKIFGLSKGPCIWAAAYKIFYPYFSAIKAWRDARAPWAPTPLTSILFSTTGDALTFYLLFCSCSLAGVLKSVDFFRALWLILGLFITFGVLTSLYNLAGKGAFSLTSFFAPLSSGLFSIFLSSFLKNKSIAATLSFSFFLTCYCYSFLSFWIADWIRWFASLL